MRPSSRQIGWSTEANLYWQISNQLDYLIKVWGKGNASLQIGQLYQGGIIFYLDNTGQHGLIRAIDADLGLNVASTQYQYCANLTTVTGATGTAIGTGLSNTNLIIATDPTSQATTFCTGYSGGGYNDWYLPSSDELLAIYTNGQYPDFISLGSPIDASWASTEMNAGSAYVLSPSFNPLPVDTNKDGYFNVIPIRSF